MNRKPAFITLFIVVAITLGISILGVSLINSAQPSKGLTALMDTIRATTGTRNQPEEIFIELDRSEQVIELDIPPDLDYAWREEAGTHQAPIFASLADIEHRPYYTFVSASILALKAKQFDDGLYAAIEYAADEGVGSFPARPDLIRDLQVSLLAKEGGSDRTLAVLTASLMLSGKNPNVPAELQNSAEKELLKFSSNPLRSRPIGFYTWNDRLREIFQRDRMLQILLPSMDVEQLLELLAEHDGLNSAYDATLILVEKLTNPLVEDDLRTAVQTIRSGGTPRLPRELSIFPPSRSFETDLIKALYGDKPIPEGFDLSKELINRIQDGRLSIEPTTNSGWYDFQTFSLEPLIIPEQMPEAQHLRFSDAYRKELELLFRSLLALTRETHIKQLEEVLTGSAGPPIRLTIRPNLTIEPLPSHYFRRYQSYTFVRGVLTEAFGRDGLRALNRVKQNGPVAQSLEDELKMMQDLFLGAYLLSCRQIGMPPNPSVDLSSQTHALRVYQSWAEEIRRDPDLAEDFRMMVPVFYDLQREQTKVWIVMGIASKKLSVSFVEKPEVNRIWNASGAQLKESDVDILYLTENHSLYYLVTAEMYVSELLDRDQFRQHCDRYQTFEAITTNLN